MNAIIRWGVIAIIFIVKERVVSILARHEVRRRAADRIAEVELRRGVPTSAIGNTSIPYQRLQACVEIIIDVRPIQSVEIECACGTEEHREPGVTTGTEPCIHASEILAVHVREIDRHDLRLDGLGAEDARSETGDGSSGGPTTGGLGSTERLHGFATFLCGRDRRTASHRTTFASTGIYGPPSRSPRGRYPQNAESTPARTNRRARAHQSTPARTNRHGMTVHLAGLTVIMGACSSDTARGCST